MLEVKNICKTYKVGEIETKALDDISVAFREREFVAILGTSGSGKTTCLNIIGGLDRYDSGDLIIKGKTTKEFKDKDWDAYRNNTIGFVFQSYNLISHLSIVANVELGMTLSGVSAEEKHKRALDVLEQVGLKDHLHKKPNQLSGGQMQRVAIARALANDPEILLCDEPTGALDTATSVQIMDLIKEVAKERLVIMVTHNPELAEEYADRIIRFKDGKIISDSHPHIEKPKKDEFNLKKTSMSFFTALKLSFNNIMTKKGRTFLTAFASSIGIIGIAVILSLSSGFQKQIDDFQSNTMAEFPIIISQTAMDVDEEDINEARENMTSVVKDKKEYIDSDEVYLYDSIAEKVTHKNNLSDEYLDYVQNIDPKICKSIGYTRIVNMNLMREIDGKAVPITFKPNDTTQSSGSSSSSGGMSSMGSAGLQSYPENLNQKDKPYIEENYELIAGDYPKNETDLTLVVDTRNRIDSNILKAMGFETEDIKSIKFSDIVGTEFKIVPNNVYYQKLPTGNYIPGTDFDKMYNDENCITVKITGIVRQSPNSKLSVLSKGIVFSDSLSKKIIEDSKNSDIVKAQLKSNKNVMTMQEIDEESKEMLISYLGGSSKPYMITVFPTSFEDKDATLEYLDAYNKGKSNDDIVMYTDLAGTMSELSGGIMDGITIVLIAFAAISLVVSLIMISIITYTSVLERTKEIGILKALGARKKDISRVFDAETFIIGAFSGLLGIAIAYLLTIPINAIIFNMTELENVAQLQILHAVILLVISTVLTMLGGHIPARIAAKKDAVEALRSE